VSDLGGGPSESVVHFRMYSSYASFIKRLKFEYSSSSSRCKPRHSRSSPSTTRVLRNGIRQQKFSRARHAKLKYLLRAYDSNGNFDETERAAAAAVHEPSPGKVAASDGPSARELLAALWRE